MIDKQVTDEDNTVAYDWAQQEWIAKNHHRLVHEFIEEHWDSLYIDWIDEKFRDEHADLIVDEDGVQG